MKTIKLITIIVVLIFSAVGSSTPVAKATITSPSDISSLKLWLDADDIDGDGNAANDPSDGTAVTTWTDKSGNDLDATQATESRRPTFSTNSLNGKPTIQFAGEGVAQQLSAGASTTNWTFLKDQTGSSVFIVIKSLSSSSGDATDFILHTNGWQFYNYANDSSFVHDYPHLQSYPATDGTLASQYGYNTHSIILNSSSPAFEHYVEGGILSRVLTTKFPNTTSSNDTLSIAGNGSTTYPLEGNIAEIIMYNKAVSTTERQDVECYLETKWGLSTNACASATPPSLSTFTSVTANGTYGVGQAIRVVATFSKNVHPASTMTVVLDTGDSVVLNKVFQNTLYGVYVPNVGDASSDLNVSSITSGSVTDVNGNTITSFSMPSAGNNIAGQKAIVVATNTTQVPVIIIAGQSNALGRADLSQISRTDGTPNVKIFSSYSTDFETLVQGTNQHDDLSATQFGPEMGAAYLYEDELDGDSPDLYIIKIAVGNTFLKPTLGYRYWDPATFGGLFDTLISRSQTAFTKINTAGFTPNMLGMYWLQGENDAVDATAASEYEDRLTDLVSETRSRLGFATLPIAVGRVVTGVSGGATVRAAEAAVVNAGTNMCLLDLDDLSMQVDGHFDHTAEMTMGARVWNAFKDCSNTVPTISAKTINGSAVTLTFDKSLNTYTTPSTSAFDLKVNGTSVAISGLAVSGSQITFTTTSVLPSDTVTLTYTIPGSDPIQDWVGNRLATISSPISLVNQTPITVLSSVTATPTSTGAVITWTSDVAGSSIVDYGLTSSYGSSTDETDTSPRTLSHSVTVGGFQRCTTVNYRVRSIDADSVTAVSSNGAFRTSGCRIGGGIYSFQQPAVNPIIPVVSSVPARTESKPIVTPAVSAPVKSKQVSTSSLFNRSLSLGATGEDVRVLQKYLNASGFVLAVSGPGSPGKETAFFGALTKKALSNFQKSNKITPSIGYLGPITRGFIKTQGDFEKNLAQSPSENKEVCEIALPKDC